MKALAAPDIPTRLDDITAEWIGATVGEGRALPAHVSFERIGAGVGLMGELARFTLDWGGAADAGPTTVVVKLPGVDASNRATGQVLGLYEREVRFYLELAHELPVHTPRRLHAAYEPDPNAPADPEQFETSFARLPIFSMRWLLELGEWMARRSPRGAVLVLEDLSTLRCGDQLEGGSLDDWRRAIDALAELHAASWQREPWLSLPWLARMRPNIRFSQAMFSRQYRRLPPYWASRLEGDGQRLGDWLSAHGIELMHALAEAPETLCHSDYRLDNLFFDDTGDRVVMVDWQLPSRGAGVLDLAYFLAGVLVPDVTREAEEALVARYHARLLALGVRDYPWPRCLADYRRAQLANWQRCISSATSVEASDERGAAMLASWWDRASARLGGIDPDAVLAAGRAAG